MPVYIHQSDAQFRRRDRKRTHWHHAFMRAFRIGKHQLAEAIAAQCKVAHAMYLIQNFTRTVEGHSRLGASLSRFAGEGLGVPGVGVKDKLCWLLVIFAK